jgi:hypothetical protein
MVNFKALYRQTRVLCAVYRGIAVAEGRLVWGFVRERLVVVRERVGGVEGSGCTY